MFHRESTEKSENTFKFSCSLVREHTLPALHLLQGGSLVEPESFTAGKALIRGFGAALRQLFEDRPKQD